MRFSTRTAAKATLLAVAVLGLASMGGLMIRHSVNNSRVDADSGDSYIQRLQGKLTVASAPASTAPAPATHVATAGQGLSQIAAQYGLDWHVLCGANGVAAPYVLSIGQQLRLPAAGEQITPCADLPSRPERVLPQHASRSGRRGEAPLPAAPPVNTPPTSPAVAYAGPTDPASNRALGQKMAEAYGWAGEQWQCLDNLWSNYESGWQVDKYNKAGSGAYGIPQALPGDKMASAGADWKTNPETQIRWGLGYIVGRYGTPCKALVFRLSKDWY